MRATIVLMLAALAACAPAPEEEPAGEPASTTATATGETQKRFDLIAPIGAIDRLPTEMRWRVGPGLMGCRAIVVTETNESIWTSPPSDEGFVTVPEGALGALSPGEPYYWKVVCAFSGLQIGSQLAQFSLVRP